MATPILSLFLLSLFLRTAMITTVDATVYFSKSTVFFSDYQKMLTNFKIFIYPQNNSSSFNYNFTTPPLSLFYTSLLTSPFITHNPNQANLFFLPFSPQPTRSLARLIQTIRTSYPYWDRSLGADHFYLSSQGVGPSGSRNVVELKKNAVQISCFPSPAGDFIPHKDVTLPPPNYSSPLAVARGEGLTTRRRLGYWRFDTVLQSESLIDGLRNDRDFLIESEPSDKGVDLERIRSSKFCLFAYDGKVMVELLVEALMLRCVPVVITDRPIQDLPLMDVIRWSEIALFVGTRVEPEKVKVLLNRTCEGGGYERMSNLGAAAAHHFVWNESPQPYDAFNMVVYQLWLKRHAIRYARWEMDVPSS